MQCNITSARRLATFAVGLVVGLSVMAGSASAAPKSDHQTSQATTWTENNDTNDGSTVNNVSDEGDNAHPSGKDRSVESGGSGNQGQAASDPDDDGRGPERTNGGADKPNGPGGRDLADQDGNNGCGNDDDFEDDNEGWCGKPQARERSGETTKHDVNSESKATSVRQSQASSTHAAAKGPAAVKLVDVAPVEPQPQVAPEPAAPASPASPTSPTSPTSATTASTATIGSAMSAVRGSPSTPTQVLAESVQGPGQAAHAASVSSERARSAAGERATEVLGVSYERADLARTGADLTVLTLGALVLMAFGFGMKRLSRQG